MEDSGGAVPETRFRRLGPIVKQTGDDELVVRAHGSEDARGLARVAIVRSDRTEIADGLLQSMEHQLPVRYLRIACAGWYTIALR